MGFPFCLMGSLFGFFNFESPSTMLILGALAVLLFGERLPEVARSIGKGLMEVKDGMRGIQKEIESAVSSATSTTTPTPSYREPEHREEATAPKFEPPPEPPVA